jgi:prepilin-type N-terminal cleavage/methylation domain-containing protein
VERVATGTVPGLASRAAVRRGRRGGFTLIEMLVVIGIILLLMSIGVLGYRSIERSNTERATKTALVNGEGFLKEMNAIGALAMIEGPSDASPAPVYVSGASLASPGDVSPGKAGRNTAILNNQKMIKVFRLNPKNKTALANLPSNLVLPVITTSPPGGYDPQIPVLIDAWGNPLIYVPSGGLTNVNFAESGSTGQKIYSSGQANSPQNRGFWASAGPDGSFDTGGDNLYSFQQ